VTSEVFAALDEAGIQSILLKGPTIVRALYGDGGFRPYSDTDVLVSPAGYQPAERVLEALGFAPKLADVDHPDLEPDTQRLWLRGLDQLDLHMQLEGIGAPPARTWDLLSVHTQSQRVAGTDVRALDPPALAVQIVLHALHHGREAYKSTTDLRRAITRFDHGVWRDAAQLAEELEAHDAFATGMRMLPEGERLADELGVTAASSVESLLRVDAVPMSQGFESLASTPGVLAKLRLIWEELVPSPAFMRWWSPLARRGRVGLALAYLWRPIWFVGHAPAGLRAWRRARSRASG
jgi:hypothetical protein